MTADVLVTGGAGFIGSHLVDALLDAGKSVRILDNLSTGRRENCATALRNTHCEFIEGDITDFVTCRKAAEGVDCVYHLAARGSVPRSVADPIATHTVNATGTLNVLVAARDAKVRRVVLSSSSSVYGNTPTLPKVETMSPAPRSPYAISKLVGEQYAQIFCALYGLETIALRYFNVFGPRQDPHSQYAAVIPAFCQALSMGTPPVIYGDGEQTRDFTYVANVVQANLCAGKAPAAACGKVYNIACGERISLNQLLQHLAAAFHVDARGTYEPARAGDVRDSLADIAAATSAIGYRPTVSVKEGIQQTVKAFRLTHSRT